MDTRLLYEHLEQDTDENYYFFMNHDIKSIYDDDETKPIRAIFKKYEDTIPQTYYIIGNYLYFTLNDNKYYHSISNSDAECNYIDKIIEELKQYNCSNFFYNPGRLD